MTNVVDFGQTARKYSALAEQTDIGHTKENHLRWLTYHTLHLAYTDVANCARMLTEITIGGELAEHLVAQITAEILAIESMVANIDIERTKTDIRYAGSLLPRVRVAREAAAAVGALGDGIRLLTEATAKCTEASERHVVVKALRIAFEDPSRTKEKYFVLKEAFTAHSDPDAIRLEIGQHCGIDWEWPDRIKLNCDGLRITFTTAEIETHFEVVEL